MSNYITVLNSDLAKSYWRAIQQADSLAVLQNNPHYTAGANNNFPKHPNDVEVGQKQVTESTTGKTTTATMIRRGVVL